jgi:26S proteasome regulatory subunit N12
MASPLVTRVANDLQRFKQIEERPETLNQRVTVMRQLMVELTSFDNLPPCSVCDPKECVLAREIYEYATFLSVEKKDIAEFERNICVLKSYYDEFEGIIPASQKKQAVIGLYLLYLLSFNK